MSAENKVNDPDSLLKKAMLQLKTSGIPISERIDPHVRINNRAKKRFGMCIMKNGSYTIELSSIMLTEPESSCMQTLCHELIIYRGQIPQRKWAFRKKRYRKQQNIY